MGQTWKVWACHWAFAVFVFMGAAPGGAAEESPGEAAGAGRLSREVETLPAVICCGCISPVFSSQGKGSIVPYGRIELDAIYSNRNTNPLDPRQFMAMQPRPARAAIPQVG